MAASTRETLVRWLRARSALDIAQLTALTAPDARWESPVAGAVVGREAVVRNLCASFEETDHFDSEILALECRGDRGIAVLHNTGRRGDDELDSLQTLFLCVRDGAVAEARVAVDDEAAVENFWAGAADRAADSDA